MSNQLGKSSGSIWTSSTAILLYAILPLSILLGSCEIIEGIFKAGMAVGIILVLLVVGLVVWLFRKMGGRS
jgi:hypothetical protein